MLSARGRTRFALKKEDSVLCSVPSNSCGPQDLNSLMKQSVGLATSTSSSIFDNFLQMWDAHMVCPIKGREFKSVRVNLAEMGFDDFGECIDDQLSASSDDSMSDEHQSSSPQIANPTAAGECDVEVRDNILVAPVEQECVNQGSNTDIKGEKDKVINKIVDRNEQKKEYIPKKTNVKDHNQRRNSHKPKIRWEAKHPSEINSKSGSIEGYTFVQNAESILQQSMFN